MKRKLLSFALCLALALSLLPTAALAEGNSGAWTDSENYDTSWYNETDTVFTVSTAKELAGLAVLVNNGNPFADKTVTLGADVDLTGHNWTPIGATSTTLFSGTFDGGGHSITNMTVAASIAEGQTYAGLFGVTASASTVKNVSVAGTVSGADDAGKGACVGGIVGLNNGTVINCTAAGSISASSAFLACAGGIVGVNGLYAITNCSTSAAVSGIAPESAGTTGAVSVGGLVGNNAGPISNCFSTGSMTIRSSGTLSLGGLAGFSEAAISYCYWQAAAMDNVNAVGRLNSGVSVTKCGRFADAAGSLTPTISGPNSILLGNTLLAALNAYVKDNLDTTLKYWKQTTGSYPVFCRTWEEALAVKGAVTITYFRISTAWELAQLAKTVNGGAAQRSAPYYMVRDIDLGLYDWVPIGDGRMNNSVSALFDGIFSGEGNSITGMRISETASAGTFYFGLFGYLGSNGSVSDLKLSGSITGEMGTSTCHAGGVAGSSYGSVRDCVCDVTVALTGGLFVSAGGIAGSGAAAENCINTGSVTASAAEATAGGIFANNIGASRITGCQNSGAVSATGPYCGAGGIIGTLYSTGGTASSLTNCANTGAVTSTPKAGTSPGPVNASVGGLIGTAVGNSGGTVTIANSYNTGHVTGAAPDATDGPLAAVSVTAGGLAGSLAGSVTLKLCYNAGAVSSSVTPAGGLAGSADSSILAQYCYWLATTTSPGMTPVAPSKSFIAAASAALAAELNDGISVQENPAAYLSWCVAPGVNDGYPVFVSGNWADADDFEETLFYADTTWFVPEEASYTITTAEQLAGLAVLVNNDGTSFAGKLVTLGADIDLSAHYWTPIGNLDGNPDAFFAGTFDGAGHTVSGMHVRIERSRTNVYAGLFGCLRLGKVERTNVTGSVFVSVDSSDSCFAGGIVGESTGMIADSSAAVPVVAVIAARDEAEKQSPALYDVIAAAGGIVGQSALVSNCWHSGAVTASGGNFSCAGGIAGSLRSSIENCYHRSSSIGVTAKNGEKSDFAGGVVGLIDMGSITNSYWQSGSAPDAVGSPAASTAVLHCASFTLDQGRGTETTPSFQYNVANSEQTGTLLSALNAWVQQKDPTGRVFGWAAIESENRGYPVLRARYTVSFSANYDGGVDPGSILLVSGGAYGTLPAPTRTNYTLDGWFTAADETGVKIESDTTANLTDNQTLYAHWTKKVVQPVAPAIGAGTSTLTFQTNGGGALGAVARNTGSTVELSGFVPVRSGYTFAGWCTDPALKQTVSSVVLTSDLTLYAKWTRSNPFTDVKADDYFFAAVEWAVEKGITAGATPTAFRPDSLCTRAQFVTFLWRAMGSPEPSGKENPFADVAPTAYYYKAVLWAVENGITKGTDTINFSPNGLVTRAQAIVFLWRAMGSPKPAGTVCPFADLDHSAYYHSAIVWAVENGITKGTGAAAFSPAKPCTRAQIVTFLQRCLSK